MDRASQQSTLWARGWINKELYEHDTEVSSLRGHGLWQQLAPLDIGTYQGHVSTIDAAPTTYDARSQGWVFAVCIHTLSLGQLNRVAAITGLPPGIQSKSRALYYGTHILAQHINQTVKLVIPSVPVAVWEAWTGTKRQHALHEPTQKTR